MNYLHRFSRAGIRMSINSDNELRMQPAWLVSSDLLNIADNHKDEIAAEIRRHGLSGVDGETSPDYHILMVATNLEFWEVDDPRYGYEVMLDVCYRQLDAEFYAWLRNHMEDAKSAHRGGHLNDVAYASMCKQFRAIRTWALTQIGEDALLTAIRGIDVATYIPPSDQTFAAYRQTWEDAWEAHTRLDGSDQSELAAQGGKFTGDELALMVGLSPEPGKLIDDAKRVFGGKVVPTNESDIEMFADAVPAAARQTPRQLVLGDGV